MVAGLHNLRDSGSEFTAVIAADLPHVSEALERLQSHLASGAIGDGILAEDSHGRTQPLLAIYRTRSLRAAAVRHADAAGLAVHRLIAPLDLHPVRLADHLCRDIDTVDDASRLGIAVPTLPLAV
jgi:molybdopterin-guanine dinucleotide biosynthesis protein A